MNAETIAISLDLINRLHQEPNRDLAHLNVTGLSSCRLGPLTKKLPCGSKTHEFSSR